MYSVMVAASGRKVIAVDAMKDNLAFLHQSLKLGKTSENVLLVHNSIRFVNHQRLTTLRRILVMTTPFFTPFLMTKTQMYWKTPALKN